VLEVAILLIYTFRALSLQSQMIFGFPWWVVVILLLKRHIPDNLSGDRSRSTLHGTDTQVLTGSYGGNNAEGREGKQKSAGWPETDQGEDGIFQVLLQ